MSDNIKVAIRIRPLIAREIEKDAQIYWSAKDHSTVLQINSPSTSFSFDRVYDTDEGNQVVYQDLCAPIVESVMGGFNGTIFAYGQTSSGKTYTMSGNCGIIQNAIQDIFAAIDNMPDREFLLRVSYMEIYNEMVLDLLTPENNNLKIQEDKDGVTSVVGLKEVEIKSPSDVYNVIKHGEKKRSFGETQANEKSSRSHGIFRMIVESRMRNSDIDNDVSVAQLNLVDLAGSERSSQANALERFKEGVHINKSLLTLTQVIRQLSSGDRQHVSYRASKLTRILQNSIGGNARTVIICTVTPASFRQTLSTLNFARCAQQIKNKPVVNLVTTDKALLMRYTKEIKKLSEKLMEVQKHSEDNNQETLWKELEEKRKQNEDLKKQIHVLKEKFIVSHLKTQIQPNINKINRRETWCFGLQNHIRPPSKSVDFLSQLPVLSEEDSVTSVSPGAQEFESVNDISSNLLDSHLGLPNGFIDTLQLSWDAVEVSTQTVDSLSTDQMIKLLKMSLHYVSLATFKAYSFQNQFDELCEFTILEKQCPALEDDEGSNIKVLSEEKCTFKKYVELMKENSELKVGIKYSEDKIKNFEFLFELMEHKLDPSFIRVEKSVQVEDTAFETDAISDNLKQDPSFIKVEKSVQVEDTVFETDANSDNFKKDPSFIKVEKSVQVEDTVFETYAISDNLQQNLSFENSTTDASIAKGDGMLEAGNFEQNEIEIVEDEIKLPVKELQEEVTQLKSSNLECQKILDAWQNCAAMPCTLSSNEDLVGYHLMKKSVELECENQVKKLQYVIDTLQTQVNARNVEVEQLHKKQAERSVQFDAMSELIECMKLKLNEKKMAVCKCLEEACKVIEDYFSDMKANKSEKKILSDKISSQQAQLEQLQKDKDEIASRLAALQKEASDLKNEKETLLVENERLENRIKLRDSNIELLDEQMSSLMKEKEKQSYIYDTRISELAEENKLQIIAFEEEISAAHQQKLCDQERKLKESFNVEMKKRLEDQASQHRLEKLKIEENTFKLSDSVRDKMLSAMSDQKQELDAKTAEFNKLTQTLHRFKHTFNSPKETGHKEANLIELSDTLKEMCQKTENDKLEYCNQINSLKEENERLKNFNSELNDKVKKLECEIDQIKLERKAHLEINQKLKAECQPRTQVIDELENKSFKENRPTVAVLTENSKYSNKSTSNYGSIPLNNLCADILVSPQKRWRNLMQSQDDTSSYKQNAEIVYENRKLQERVKNLEHQRELLQQKLSSYRNEIRRLQEKGNESRVEKSPNQLPSEMQIAADSGSNMVLLGPNAYFELVLRQKDEYIKKLEKEKNMYLALITSKDHTNLEAELDTKFSYLKDNLEQMEPIKISGTQKGKEFGKPALEVATIAAKPKITREKPKEVKHLEVGMSECGQQ